MKIRTGFVSNSSSSSFIVAIPKDMKDEEMFLELRESLFNGVDEKAPIRGIIEPLWKTLKPLIDHEDNEKIESIDQLIEFNCYDDEEQVRKFCPEYVKYLDEGYRLICGSFSNENYDSLECFLADHDWNFETKNIKFIHEGGY